MTGPLRDTQEPLIAFDVQVYGEGGGVMSVYRVEGASAERVADDEAEHWRGHPQAGTVGVWSADRKHGSAHARVSGV